MILSEPCRMTDQPIAVVVHEELVSQPRSTGVAVEVVVQPCRQTRRHWFSVVGRGLGGWLYVMSAGWMASWLARGQRQQDGEPQMVKVSEGTNAGAPTAHAGAAVVQVQIFWISGGVTYPAKRRLLGEPFFWASTISVADIVGAVRGPCQVARLAGLEPRRTQSGGTSDDAARWRGSQLRRPPSATAPACRRRPRGRTSSSASCPAHPVETRPRPHARRLSE